MERVKRKFNKIIACLCLGATMALSGLFFVGCGDNPADRLTLTPDKSVVEVFAGESENITFTIGNYTNGIDTSLNFALIDSTVSSTKSEHAKLDIINQDGTETTVKITGISGGTTTLVATTKEGYKPASVTIKVRQYSSKFKIKNDSLLYVSKSTPFMPSESLFDFDESATERKVSFHFTDALSQANDNNAFVKAELVADENDIYSVVFYQDDGHAIILDEYKNLIEGTGISIIAKYYNPQTDKTESQKFTLTVLYGFDADVKIEAYDGDGQVEKIELVTNDPVTTTENWRSKKFTVKVPRVENYEGNKNVKFDCDYDKDGPILVEKVENTTLSTENYVVYDFEVVSTVVDSKETYIKLRLYYQIDGISYAGSGDSSVEQQLEIPVFVRIAPTNIVVNSLEQTSIENQYDFYNHYDGEYGWKEFKVDVYNSDSSFDYVLMTFDNDLIVKYKNKTYVAGVTTYQLQIDDVSQPIYIRGASDAAETAEPKQITFEVISKYARETFSYKCNYSILTGVTDLAFDNPNTSYEYNPKQEETGIFVSTSSVAGVVFTHLVADNDFSYVNVKYDDLDASVARVVYDGKEDYEASEFGKIVKLKIIPYKVGSVSYKITLDNGVSKTITFRIVDTFDNLSVDLAGSGNEGVQSTEKTIDGDIERLKIVIQNSTQKDASGNTKVSYGKYATVALSSSNGKDVFDNVTYTITDATMLSVNTSKETAAVLTTLSSGYGTVTFKATGVAVEDFKISKKATHSAIVDYVSFVPVYSLGVKDESGVNANNVSLYVGNMVSDAKLQTAKFNISIDPASEVYGFFNPNTDRMENSNYEEKYIYWTVNGANPYLLDNSQAQGGRMIYGKTYKIGPDPYNYFGTFDTITKTFTVNKDMKSTFSFTMFASLKQYETSKYFSVTIKGQTYDFVERIYTNLGENSLKLSPLTTSYDIGTFLNPSNATDTKVIAKFVNKNTDSNDPILIDEDAILISEVSGGINLVTINLNPEVLNNEINGTLLGVLQIIPNAWYVNGSIIAGYENSVVKISISYEDGSETNPYSLSSAEDVVAIGESSAAMKYHYRISTTIDLSAYASKLPLGGNKTFEGSIVGSDDAAIIGLKIQNGNNGAYGLFNSISGKIENLTFKGRININSKSEDAVNAGLVCAELKEGAILNNISAYISGGEIATAKSVVFGGLAGKNSGTISDMCVVFEDYVNITSTQKDVKAGGIAGTSTGNILGRENISKRFGISAYSVYALIRVGDSTNLVPEYGQAAAVVAVQAGSKITNILAGGVILAEKAGGLVGTFENNAKTTEISDLTIRTQIRGQDVGLIAVKADDGALNNDFKNIKIQATDDGESLGINASMYVKIKNQIDMSDSSQDIPTTKVTSESEGVETTETVLNLDKILLADSGYTASGQTTFASYVNRDCIDINFNEIDFDFTTDEYFGDVIFVSATDKIVNYVNFFAKQTTSVDVLANEENGFKKLNSSSGTANVIFAYYFEAAGYYGADGFTTEQIYNAQNILDSLNHVGYGDRFYPIKIAGSDISISSKSSLVEVSASGDLYIKGTGIAELEVSSLLNKKQNEKVYLYIINFFNIDSYLKTGNDKETGIFTLGELVLGENSEFSVYANAGVSVMVSPSYKYGNFEMEINGQTCDVNISSSGLVKIGNDLIQLSKNHSVSADFDGELNYGTATKFRDGITFSKKGIVGENQTDKIALKATMSQEIAGETYALDITTLKDVVINYYEGAKAIKTLSENYVLSSSITVLDTYLIDSDDNADAIVEENCIFVDAESGKKVDLFNLELNDTAGDLTYSAQISVDKNSDEFKNRFNENIYKDYILKLKATSNEHYLKEIPVTLVQENVDVIALTNYKIISSTNSGKTTWGLEEYNNIVPGSRGILSVTLSPVDADFDYLQITNNEMNTLEGASQGTFVFGLWSEDNGFETIQGSEYVEGGVRISKANLEKAFKTDGFMGQVYVRYIFSNQDVEDKAPVGIDVTVSQSGGQISRTAKYNFYKKDDISVSLKGFTNKQYVARGLEYELDVKAVGFDEKTISLTSNKPQQATIVERDGKYFVKITNDPIDYNNSVGLVFTITLSASKTDDSGETMTEMSELNLTILEYVINFDNSNSEDYDIVSGVENGIMNLAVGDKTKLSIAFDGLIEYNRENANVEAMVTSLLSELSTKGTWTIYTDLNQNTVSGESAIALPINKTNATKTIITSVGEFNIKYLKISDLGLTTIQSHDPNIAERYFFTYDGKYTISGGKYIYEATAERSINTRFGVYSYMRGSEESPNPVTSYKEFLEMEAGGYYIQLADIHVPADEFTPLNTAIKYFDGNSYKFIFDDAKYDLGTTAAVGVFGSVNAKTILKNITVQTGSDEVDYVEFNSLATSAIHFGFIAGINSGAITNAKVVNAGISASLTFKNAPSSEGYYFGGVAGQNTGYITHCQTSFVLDSCISMGGIVGANQGSGIVASSMFKDGKITNTSIYNDVFGVGGIAATNSEKAEIITSYSSGKVRSDCVYSDFEDGSLITSSVPVGGFIYYNEGTIRDCYSNIPLVTTSRSSGFVFNNDGKIVRSFSTSQIVNDYSATNYYFAGEGIGTFESCYYITGDINKTLSPLTHVGVEKLRYTVDNANEADNKNEFSAGYLAEKFADYSYAETASYNSVWFYSDGNESTLFASQQFAGGRLELVSANIIAKSKKEHIKTTVSADGISTYIYATVSGSPDDGSVFNPYVIYSPETMEGYFVTGNSSASGNYRLACPIDYSSTTSNYTNLYKVDLKGNLEANGMSLSGITLVSNDQLTYAGLFGSVTGSTSSKASIMNLNFTPKEVAFSNVSEVGAIAGRIQNANLYNINVYGSSSGDEVEVGDNLATVTGKNIVGGVVGLAKDGYKIKNVHSLIGAFATNVPYDKSEIDYEREGSDYNNLSFAGGVVGYLAGTGSVSDLLIDRAAINIIGGKIGFVFGGTSKGSTVKNVYLKLNSSMQMKAYRYAGFISGEVKGKLQGVYVYGYSSQATGADTLITLKPYSPVAVGGIAALLNGGEIAMAYVSQGLEIGNLPTASVEVNTIDYVGGIVGQVKGSGNKLSQVLATGDLSAKNVLGGIVGQVSASASLVISEAAFKASDLTVEGQNAAPAAGGIVGAVGEKASLSISNSYVRANITVKTYAYSTQINANFGGIIGAKAETNSPIIKLENIYTTSIYNITLEDKSSTNATGMVYDGWEASTTIEGGRNYNVDGYYLDGDGKIEGEIDKVPHSGKELTDDQKKENDDINKKNGLRQVNYSLKQTTTSCTNVYNSSIYSASKPIMDKGYTTLFARRFKDTTIMATQNEYGTDLYSLILKDIEKDANLFTNVEYTIDKAFNNLFSGNSLWKTSETANSYLAFEENLKLS